MEEPQRPTLSRELDRGTLDAHRLLVMWLFICSIVIGLSFVALVLYFDVTGGGGLTIGVAVIVAGGGGGFVSSLRRLYSLKTSSLGANTFTFSKD